MNKTAIKNYAIWARVNLIEAAKQRAYQYEITKDNITDANADVVSGKPLTKEEKRKEFWRTIKFILFSISAGIIEFGSFSLLTLTSNIMLLTSSK